MARIIELSGPSGAGKTTIMKTMSERWNKDHSWIPDYKMFPHQKIDLFDLTKLAKNLPFLFRYLETDLDHTLLNDAGKRFIQKYPDFVDAYWHYVVFKQKRDQNGKDSRFRSSAIFHNIIQKYQYLSEVKDEKYVLFDEGIIHRLPVSGSVFNQTIDEDKKDIFDLIKVMPLPSAFIYVDSDIDTIMKRVQQRKKVAPMHKKKSFHEIMESTCKAKERMSYVKETLISMNVPVLSIDSKHEIQHSIKEIEKFISELKTLKQNKEVLLSI